MNSSLTNHLIGEKSPYLLQHAHNPVDWYPWGDEAFTKAERENKPVLLSIGYSTCHWCHVMAHESFEDAGIAKIINAHFVPIKVDREERPDIDHIYMAAVIAMTGQGGWPLTAFLTPQGEPFYAGTYFSPYAKWGNPGFIDLLESIAKAWASDRENIISSGRSVADGLRLQAQRTPASETMSERLLETAFIQMKAQFDKSNGGFGSAPKFPMGHNLSFLLRYHQQHQGSEALIMTEKTLAAMARGGIWDHLAGGFHRYSTDLYWQVPHFEKMLYDQALLARAYLEAYQTTGSIQFAQTARATLEYVMGCLTDPRGGFYSAEDADSLEDGHLKEGAFYVFTKDEIEKVLGKEEAQIFDSCYGVKEEGNAAFDPHGEFKAKNILHLVHSDGEEVGLDKARQKLLEYRARRPRPHRDEKVLCDWNGLMIAAFSLAGRVLGEDRYTQAAVKAADFILGHMKKGERLLHRWGGGEAGIMATLDDHAFLTYGLLELYEASFQPKYLAAAQELTDTMIAFFADPAGGFYMTASDAEVLIMRPKDIYDGALPSGNSVAALNLLKLHALTQQEAYLKQAEGLFKCFAASVGQAPYAHCFLLSALYWHLNGPLEITFEAVPDDVTVAKMLKVLYKHFVPLKAVKLVTATNAVRAHICRRGICQAPVSNAESFEKELLSLNGS